jgi:heme-degrading monooxygenase HmoA
MGDIYTSGSWKPTPGSEEAFIEAWTQFAAWGSNMTGAGTLRLLRDVDDPSRFVSFGDWDTLDEARGWKATAEFKEQMAQVLQHCAEFQPSNLREVASARNGAGAATAAAV